MVRSSAASALVALVVAACGEEKINFGPGQPVPGPPLPGLDPDAVGLPGPYVGVLGDQAMPCKIHYDFADPQPDVDCTVEDAGGTLAWKVTCPAHNFLPVEDDLTFNDAGELIAETAVFPPAPHGSGTTTAFSLRALGPPRCTELEMNDAGQLVRAHCVNSDSMLPDGTTVRGDRIVTRGYDSRGRFIHESSVEKDTYVLDSEVRVTYDDTTGRRDVAIDFLPGHTITFTSTSSDAFDDQPRLVQRTIVNSGVTTVYGYEYDDMGRLGSLTADVSGDPQSKTSWTAQRSYDCH